MSENTFSTPVLEAQPECGIENTRGAAAMAHDQASTDGGSRVPEPIEPPFFVVVRPPIPGRTAWSMAPW